MSFWEECGRRMSREASGKNVAQDRVLVVQVYVEVGGRVVTNAFHDNFLWKGSKNTTK